MTERAWTSEAYAYRVSPRFGEVLSFPVRAVREVRIGTGWARRGMRLIVLPWYADINSLARG